jgi:hypothetical protein
MNDAQRYRMNAAKCISAGERREPGYRDLNVRRRGTLAVAGAPVFTIWSDFPIKASLDSEALKWTLHKMIVGGWS